MNSTHFLSKSQFLRGLQCHKYLWLYKYRPELRTPPDEALDALFEAGNEIGVLAHELFPGGVLIEFEGSSFYEKAKKTGELIESGVKTIYEATFRYDDMLVMVDILHKGDDGWELYEVKKSTDVKDVHISDVSFQYHVVTGSGLPLAKASLVYINNKYVRQGNIAVRELFQITDLTDTVVAGQDRVKDELGTMRGMLDADCPTIDIGAQCSTPYECNFINHCWAHIPENSVFDLKAKGINKFAFYKSGKIHFKDIDLNDLNLKQRMQVDAELNGTVTIDRDGIMKFLDTLHYPLWFLDFEALYEEAIPPFDGTRPYSKIPFQYSLHCIEKEGGELKHYEFLAEAGTDGREPLVKRLVSLIPEDACILTYNMTFEKSVIADLAEQFPEYSAKLMKIHENIKDLMVPFRQRHYYKKEMKGSYSLKYVLPALLPDLSYQGMAVSNGDEAVLAYKRLPSIEKREEAEKVKDDLLEYCKLDTLGMVKLFEKLKDTTVGVQL